MFLGKHEVWIYLLLFNDVQTRKKEIKEKKKAERTNIYNPLKKTTPQFKKQRKTKLLKNPTFSMTT